MKPECVMAAELPERNLSPMDPQMEKISALSPTEKRADAAILLIAGAYAGLDEALAVGEEAVTLYKTLKAVSATLAASGAIANAGLATVDVVTGKDTSAGRTAINAVTTASGIATTLKTKSVSAGSTASDVQTTVQAGANLKGAAKDPVGTWTAGRGVYEALKNWFSKPTIPSSKNNARAADSMPCSRHIAVACQN